MVASRRVGITALIASLIAVSGCATEAAPSTSEQSPAAASASPAVLAEPGLPGYKALREVTLANGSYTQITLADDNPLMQYNDAAVIQAVKDKFTQEQIVAAQQVAMRWIVEEGVDSRIADNATPETIAQWLDENRDKWTNGMQETITTKASEPNAGGLVNSYTDAERGYPLVADGSPRVAQINVALDQVFLAQEGNMAFKGTQNFQRRATVSEGGGVEVLTGTYVLGVVEEDGGWKLAGWETNWRGTKGANQP